jgi:hypothetical protein
MISDPARALLAELVDAGAHLRPKGDCRLGQELQTAQLAVMVHVDDRQIRITPNDRARRWIALLAKPGMRGNGRTWKGVTRD